MTIEGYALLPIEELRDRLRDRATPEPMSGCWLWDGQPNAQGYGRITIGRRQVVLAHRFSYEIYVHPVERDVCVLHRCDVRICINPRHLFPGDRGVNARDMAAKGRQAVQRNPLLRPICPPEKLRRGERHPNSRLTAETIRAIRQRFAAGEKKSALARAYGIAISHLTSIVTGALWKDAGGPIAERTP